jgi:hypothetical protein
MENKTFLILLTSKNCHGCIAEKHALEKIGLNEYAAFDIESPEGRTLADIFNVKGGLPTTLIVVGFSGYPGSPKNLLTKIIGLLKMALEWFLKLLGGLKS